MSDIPQNIRVFNDDDEWTSWKKRGDPVLHIELSKWADVFVIAPLDANTLAKMANVSRNVYLFASKCFSLCNLPRDCVIICSRVQHEPGKYRNP